MTDDFFLREKTALDLTRKYFDHNIRDIRVIGSWLQNTPARSPCLVLVPKGQDLKTAKPCVVPLGAAWQWAEETCDEVECVMLACEFCLHLGKNPMHNPDIMQVISTVRDRLYDLINMPPEPLRERKVIGDVSIRIKDGPTMEREIKTNA
jgi:hypothetical protein